jgi:protein-tyrosine-phosphatase
VRLVVAELNWTGLLAVEYRTAESAPIFVDLRFGLASWEGAGVAAIRSAIRAMIGTADDAARVLPGVDPLPAAARVAHLATRAISKASTNIRALLCGVTGSRGRRRLHPSDSILFVCQGNINRSLVAEQALRRAGFRWVASAALIGMSGRWPSGPAERYVRDVLGMPTDALRSRSLRQGLSSLDRIDVVVCFERRQVVDVLRRHPELRGRVHLLTTLAGRDGGPLDIADPHARSDECHRDCFERISRLLRSATSPAAAAPRLAPGSP